MEPAAGLPIHSFSQSGELETGPEEYSARPRPQPVRLALLLGGDAKEVGRKEERGRNRTEEAGSSGASQLPWLVGRHQQPLFLVQPNNKMEMDDIDHHR